MSATYFSDGRVKMQNGRVDHRAAVWGADWWLGRDVRIQNKPHTVEAVDGDTAYLSGGVRLPLSQLNLSLVRGSITLI